MKCVETISDSYQECIKFDLMNDKKVMIFVNGLSIALMIGMILIGTLYSYSISFMNMVTGFCGVIVYIMVHELIHGLFMKLNGSRDIHFGFNGIYAFAASDSYFYKWPYLFIVLAPVLLLGVSLALLCVMFGAKWFWTFYLIQIVNVSGASGDLYVFFKLLKYPKDILVKDTGVSMSVYDNR